MTKEARNKSDIHHIHLFQATRQTELFERKQATNERKKLRLNLICNNNFETETSFKFTLLHFHAF